MSDSVAVITVAIFVVALVVRRPIVLLFAAAVWPLLVLGVAADWWGSRLGERWELALVIETVIAVVAAALGITLGRAIDRLHTSRGGPTASAPG